MSLEEKVYRVLVVSASEKFNSSMVSLLPKKNYSPIQFVTSISAAQQEVAERTYDIIFINAPLPDDFGRRFAIDMSAGKNSVVALLVRNDVYDEIYEKVMEHGVLTLHKPTSTSMLNQSLDWMRAICERLHKLEKKTISLEDKMSEIRIVNRAKWALIEHCHMTEGEAHRYIEKQAMDRCVTRREVAESILKNYK